MASWVVFAKNKKGPQSEPFRYSGMKSERLKKMPLREPIRRGKHEIIIGTLMWHLRKNGKFRLAQATTCWQSSKKGPTQSGLKKDFKLGGEGNRLGEQWPGWPGIKRKELRQIYGRLRGDKILA